MTGNDKHQDGVFGDSSGVWERGCSLPEEYYHAYSGMWAFLDSIVNMGGAAGHVASAGQFLPYLHHKLHSTANHRARDPGMGIAAQGRADLEAYEDTSNKLSAGALFSLEQDALKTMHSRYGDAGGDDYVGSLQAMVGERRRERLTFSTSPSSSGGSSSNKAATNDNEGELRWDYVYYCLRHGLYSEAGREIAAVAKKSGTDLLGSGGKSSKQQQPDTCREGKGKNEGCCEERSAFSVPCMSHYRRLSQ